MWFIVHTRFQQTKNDEIIARTLQNDEGSPEMLHSEVTPSAPPASEIFDDQAIALELQNMENDEHGMKVEKERLEFEERKEKEMIKMKQVCTLPPVFLNIGLLNAYTFCSNTGSIRDDPYWSSRKNSLELI